MAPLTGGAVAMAFFLDVAIGELPTRIHPVAAYGRVVDYVESASRASRRTGVLIAAVLPVAAAGIAYGATLGAVLVDPLVGTAVVALILFSTTSLRMLVEEAFRVVELSVRDIEAARSAVPALVGRDPDNLSPAELRSAAVESAAENLGDGLVGPLLAFVLGATLSLPAGAAATVWVKAVNTGDSMVGYPSNPHGAPTARLDDSVQWLPARLSAILLALVSARPLALRRARAWASLPASPNAGWPMATLAAILDVQLRKPGAYTLNPTASLPSTMEAKTGIYLVGFGGVVAYAAAGVIVWF